MRMKQRLYLSVAAGALFATCRRPAGASSRADGGRHRQRRHRRRGHRTERPRGRRVGDRGDHRSADPLRQDGGHRRPGPLRRARSAEGQIQGVGARLRPRRFRRRSTASPASSSISRAVPAPNEAAAAQYYPAIYWYSMLKIPDASQFGGKRRHSGEGQAERLAQPDEEQRLRRLPSARPAVDAHDPDGVRRVQDRRRRLDAAAPSPGRRAS